MIMFTNSKMTVYAEGGKYILKWHNGAQHGIYKNLDDAVAFADYMAHKALEVANSKQAKKIEEDKPKVISTRFYRIMKNPYVIRYEEITLLCRIGGVNVEDFICCDFFGRKGKDD